jgi:hypothetical protein
MRVRDRMRCPVEARFVFSMLADDLALVQGRADRGNCLHFIRTATHPAADGPGAEADARAERSPLINTAGETFVLEDLKWDSGADIDAILARCITDSVSPDFMAPTEKRPQLPV